MECLVLFLVLLIVLAVFTVKAARASSLKMSRRRNYQHIARRFSGHYVPGGILSRPSVRIRYGEATAILKETSYRGPVKRRGTQLQINWADARFQLELFRDGGSNNPFANRNAHDIQVVVHEFDRDYVIRAHSDPDARAFLSEGVRWQVDRLRTFLSDDQVYVFVHRGRMFIQKPTLIRRYGDLESFVQYCLELYDQAMLTQARGIVFIEADVARPLDNVVCKVCGDEIRETMVYCRRCKTPHHHDCWQYTGACSVYGCQETRYLAPQTVDPIREPHSSTNRRDSSIPSPDA